MQKRGERSSRCKGDLMQRVPFAFIFIVLLLIPLISCGHGPSTEDVSSAPDKQKAAGTSQPAEQTTAQEAPAATDVPRYSGPITFADVTAPAGIHFKHNSGAFGKKYLPETIGAGCAFLDYDNDGWQDILLVNSMDWPEHQNRKSFLALYHNNKDGTFTDVTRQSGL